MSRRRSKPGPLIAAEDCATDERWMAAGRRLREVDPERYFRILALAKTFAGIHDEPITDAIVSATIAEIKGARRESN